MTGSAIVRVAPGDDVEVAARWAAAQILGVDPGELDRHPDFELFKSDGNVFRVPIVESIVFRSVLAPTEGRRRVFAVLEPERMSDEAANLLLKTLEEPPPSLDILFATTRPFDLPDTVRSRCAVVVAPQTDRAAALRTAGIDAGDAGRLAFLAGSSEQAARLAADPEQRELTEAWVSLPSQLIGVPITALVLPEPIERLVAVPPAGDEEARRRQRRQRTDDLLAGLQVLACLYREAAIRALGAPLPDPPMEADVDAPVARRLAEELGADGALAALEPIARARESILANGTIRLALEVLLLRLSRLRGALASVPPPE